MLLLLLGCFDPAPSADAFVSTPPAATTPCWIDGAADRDDESAGLPCVRGPLTESRIPPKGDTGGPTDPREAVFVAVPSLPPPAPKVLTLDALDISVKPAAPEQSGSRTLRPTSRVLGPGGSVCTGRVFPRSIAMKNRPFLRVIR